MLRAETEWETSQIYIYNEGSNYFPLSEIEDSPMKYGVSKKGCIGLSLNEAKELLVLLGKAIKNYEDIESSVQEYFKEQKSRRTLPSWLPTFR